MELEQLLIATEVQKKMCDYKESIKHIDEFQETKRLSLELYIAINDGWGTQRIYIPKDVVCDALGIIKDSLEREVVKLEHQFKEL